MASFEDEILGLIPAVEAEKSARKAREAEDRERAAEQKRQQAATQEKGAAMARRAVELLVSRRVPTVPVWDRQHGNGPIVQTGEGWHIVDLQTYEGADMPPGRDHMALHDDAVLTKFYYTGYTENKNAQKGTTFSGIVFPFKPIEQAGRLEFLESESFKKGIASLISGNGPYIERR